MNEKLFFNIETTPENLARDLAVSSIVGDDALIHLILAIDEFVADLDFTTRLRDELNNVIQRETV